MAQRWPVLHGFTGSSPAGPQGRRAGVLGPKKATPMTTPRGRGAVAACSRGTGLERRAAPPATKTYQPQGPSNFRHSDMSYVSSRYRCSEVSAWRGAEAFLASCRRRRRRHCHATPRCAGCAAAVSRGGGDKIDTINLIDSIVVVGGAFETRRRKSQVCIRIANRTRAGVSARRVSGL